MTITAYESVVGGSAAALPGFIVEQNGEALAAHARKLGGRLALQGVSLVISIGISVGLFFLFKVKVGDPFFWLLIISALIALGQFVFFVVRYVRARGMASKVQPSPALQIDVDGLVIAEDANGTRVPWHQVRSVKGQHRFWTPGPNLEVTWSADPQAEPRSWQVPIVYLAAQPTLLDCALRAYSRGRFGLDLGSVDQLW